MWGPAYAGQSHYVRVRMAELGGDAVVRCGLNSSGVLLIVGGFLVLGTYGIVVNKATLEFDRRCTSMRDELPHDPRERVATLGLLGSKRAGRLSFSA